MKQTLYELLNYVDTDYSKYESVEVSEDDVARLKKRMSKKITADTISKKKPRNTGRLAIVAAACLTIVGSVAIASIMKKPDASNEEVVINNQTQDVVPEKEVTTEAAIESAVQISNNEKILFNDELGASIIYTVKKQGNDNIEILDIEKTNNELKVNLKIDFEKETDISELKKSLNTHSTVNGTGWCYVPSDENEDTLSSPSPESFEGIYARTTFSENEDDEQIKASCHGAEYNFKDNTLNLDLRIDIDKEENISNKLLRLVLVVGKPYKSTYNLKVELPNFEKTAPTENKTGNHNEIQLKSSVENYGCTSDIEITKYSIDENGLILFGFYNYSEPAYDELSDEAKAARDADGVTSAEVYHRVRAWDDLGNSYILTPVTIDATTGETKWSLGGNEQSLDAGATKITFVIEKEWYTDFGEIKLDESSSSYQYTVVTSPVTIDLNGAVLGETLTDPNSGEEETHEYLPNIGESND